jgi:hypothetical protein
MPKPYSINRGKDYLFPLWLVKEEIDPSEPNVDDWEVRAKLKPCKTANVPPAEVPSIGAITITKMAAPETGFWLKLSKSLLASLNQQIHGLQAIIWHKNTPDYPTFLPPVFFVPVDTFDESVAP